MTTDPQPLTHRPAIEALGREFSRLAEEEATLPRRTRRPMLRPAPVLGLVAVLAAAAFTPPGRAVAERVGEFVGLVDDSGSVVVGLGETPQELHPYRVVANGEPTPAETCVFLEYTELEGGYGSCLAGDVPADLAQHSLSPFIYPAPKALFPDGWGVLQGLAAPDVAAVEVFYRDAEGTENPVAVDVSDFGQELQEKARVSDGPVRFFVAFLPPEAMAGSYGDKNNEGHAPAVEIRALDPQGNQLALRSLADLKDYESDLGENPCCFFDPE